MTAIAVSPAGCSNPRLEPATLDLAGSVAALSTNQVLDSLGRYVTDRSMPSVVDISGGTVTTEYAVSPSFMIPFGNMVQTGTSGSITVTEPYRQLGGALSFSQTGSWNVTPVTDPIRLQNMMALFGYITTGNTAALLQEYQLPVRADADRIYLDPYFLVPPQCVFCLIGPGAVGGRANVTVPNLDLPKAGASGPNATLNLRNATSIMDEQHLNPILKEFRIHDAGNAKMPAGDVCPQAADAGALRSGDPDPDRPQSLGSHGGIRLWIKRCWFERGYLSKFVALVLAHGTK